MLVRDGRYFKLGEDLYFVFEQESSVHFRALTADNDGVSISRDDARSIAHELLKMAELLAKDREDG